MRRILFAVALAAPVLAFAPPRQPGPAERAIDRALATYAKTKTSRARFEQTLTNPITGNTMRARGEFLQQQPNRIAVRFTEPSGDRIVGDGQHVWVYLPSSAPNQVIKLSAKNGTGGVDVAGQLIANAKERYTITDAGAATVSGRAARAVVLVPKQSGQQPFTKATVWIDDADGTMRQFEVTDVNGLTRHVRLTELTLNGAMPRDAFTFTPPKGARVVDQAGLVSGR